MGGQTHFSEPQDPQKNEIDIPPPFALAPPELFQFELAFVVPQWKLVWPLVSIICLAYSSFYTA